MAQAISTNYFFMVVVFVVITNIVTKKEKVKETKWFEKWCFFDILVSGPKHEPMLELTSTAK